ncbi:hypothetical protein Ppa06_42820 [Planomonospora parontospora subsp. parontospora]|uniref:Uncharacterized protein n=2 Tax=Planomonospora parontospora TaxID=58119 RepID=A0AA37F6F3_9ACTN|nr:hypothetical protein [Planomonospora parontospora]GGK83645.1 hypothetical protein GCM10010126_48670 [Planomonospora parontospora]GII10484.1 hypothetical protein Ppa06_42820 [Planomonospora parontospora subsp. parontospora]
MPHTEQTPWGRWEPAPPGQVVALFQDLDALVGQRRVRRRAGRRSRLPRALPLLTAPQRAWPDEALGVEYGAHPWRERLRG